jgi:hypothetical protein
MIVPQSIISHDLEKNMNNLSSTPETDTYLIIVEGKLNNTWQDWLNSVSINSTENNTITKIEVEIPDQSALRGLLNNLWDFNLKIISIQQMEKNTSN